MEFPKWFARKKNSPPLKTPGLSLFYVLLVLLPGMVLGFFALSSFEKEESLLEKRFRETLHAEMRLLSQRVLSFLEEVELELYREIRDLPPREEELFFSRWQQENPLVDIPFLLNSRLALVLPHPSGHEEPRIRAFASWGESFFEGTSSGRNIEHILTAWKESFAPPPLSREETPLAEDLAISPASLSPAQDTAAAPPPGGTSGTFFSKTLSRKASAPRELSGAPEDAPPQGASEETPWEANEEKEFVKSEEILEETRPFLFRKPYPFPEEIREKSFGLLPYMMDNRILFLFWARRGDDIGGCLLREDLLKEKLGEMLSRSLSSSGENYALAVLDEHGERIFPREEENPTLHGSPYESISMPPLLPYWSCVAFLAPSHGMLAQARESRIRHILVIGSLLFSLSGGTFLLLRTLRMEMRTAAQKTTFVAKVSHELKTPLTSLRLFAEMLQEGRISGEEKRRRYLELMVSEIERLTRLIENILDFSRRERGLKRYSLKETELSSLVEQIVESQRPRLESQGFFLSLQGKKPLGVLADEEGIAQILLNLLTNAEKYSDTRKEIEIYLGGDETSVWVDVMDRGIGIASGDRERIFLEFYRVDDSLTSRAQGAGLGLSISRNIARDHRGDLFTLPREGGGSVFRLLLPRKDGKDISREEAV